MSKNPTLNIRTRPNMDLFCSQLLEMGVDRDLIDLAIHDGFVEVPAALDWILAGCIPRENAEKESALDAAQLVKNVPSYGGPVVADATGGESRTATGRAGETHQPAVVALETRMRNREEAEEFEKRESCRRAEQMKKKKRADAENRRNVLAEVEADRKMQKLRRGELVDVDMETPHIATAAAAASTATSTTRPAESVLQIRLPGPPGILKVVLASTASLSEVIAKVAPTVNGSFHLLQAFPRRIYNEEDHFKSLVELGLAGRASLNVLLQPGKQAVSLPSLTMDLPVKTEKVPVRMPSQEQRAVGVGYRWGRGAKLDGDGEVEEEEEGEEGEREEGEREEGERQEEAMGEEDEEMAEGEAMDVNDVDMEGGVDENEGDEEDDEMGDGEDENDADDNGPPRVGRFNFGPGAAPFNPVLHQRRVGRNAPMQPFGGQGNRLGDAASAEAPAAAAAAAAAAAPALAAAPQQHAEPQPQVDPRQARLAALERRSAEAAEVAEEQARERAIEQEFSVKKVWEQYWRKNPTLFALTAETLASLIKRRLPATMKMSGLSADVAAHVIRLLCRDGTLNGKIVETFAPCGLSDLDLGDYSKLGNEIALASSRHVYLRSLNLSGGPFLTDEGLRLFNRFDCLTALDLGLCKCLTDGAVEYICELKRDTLTALSLENSKVSDHGFARLCEHFHTLERLNVAGTHVTGATLGSCALLKCLVSLNVSRTQTRSFARLPALTSLRSLAIDKVPVSDSREILALCMAVPSLTALSLAGVEVGDEALAFIGEHLQRLETILLPHRLHVSDAALPSIARLHCLRQLDLDGYRQVTDKGVASLVPLRSSLCRLSLANTNISDDAFASLIQLTELRDLVLDRTAITDAGLLMLQGHLPYLEELSLAATAVGERVSQSLNGLQHLERLNLSHTRAFDEDLMALNLPSLRLLNLDCAHISDATAGLMLTRLLLPSLQTVRARVRRAVVAQQGGAVGQQRMNWNAAGVDEEEDEEEDVDM